MGFLWPDMLWLLLLAPLLVIAYLWTLRRRKQAAVRFASLDLVRPAIGRGSRIRRHVPPFLFLLAIIAIIAVAVPYPAERAKTRSFHEPSS